MERQWTITRVSVNNNDGNVESYLEAIVDTESAAKELLQSVFNDASRKFETKHGAVYSNPEWKEEDKLQVTCTLHAGCITLSYTETFFIGWIWKEKTYNPKWILE